MKLKENPDSWAIIGATLKAIGPQIAGSAISCAVFYARIICYGDKRKNKWVEGLLCGLLSFSLSNGLSIIGLPEGSDVFVGGFIGFIGVHKLREYALHFLNKRMGLDGEKSD